MRLYIDTNNHKAYTKEQLVKYILSDEGKKEFLSSDFGIEEFGNYLENNVSLLDVFLWNDKEDKNNFLKDFIKDVFIPRIDNGIYNALDGWTFVDFEEKRA